MKQLSAKQRYEKYEKSGRNKKYRSDTIQLPKVYRQLRKRQR